MSSLARAVAAAAVAVPLVALARPAPAHADDTRPSVDLSRSATVASGGERVRVRVEVRCPRRADRAAVYVAVAQRVDRWVVHGLGRTDDVRCDGGRSSATVDVHAWRGRFERGRAYARAKLVVVGPGLRADLDARALDVKR